MMMIKCSNDDGIVGADNDYCCHCFVNDREKVKQIRSFKVWPQYTIHSVAVCSKLIKSEKTFVFLLAVAHCDANIFWMYISHVICTCTAQSSRRMAVGRYDSSKHNWIYFQSTIGVVRIEAVLKIQTSFI